ncbi:unnamed protein product [Mycena citricolor]|uniref:NAD(P)-binding domain-containing protein n=1 Tax=Mycena citricolor TaxID=2018698 RepID=A0AAD2H4M1_9AGAR|nr:unnamed protein product [Mycena citricolor]
MKLIITGATGYVGKEIVSQACKHPGFTKVVAVSRKLIPPPDGTPAGKFQSVVVSDYDQYTDEAKKELGGAGACIWTVGIIPTKYIEVGPEEAKRISRTSTLVGMQALAEASPSNPFRFLYMSGSGAVRDQTVKVEGEFADFFLMRGDVENAVFDLAGKLAGFEACAVRPGLITERAKVEESRELAIKNGWEIIAVEDCAASMLHLVINGFEKDLLSNDEMVAVAEQI